MGIACLAHGAFHSLVWKYQRPIKKADVSWRMIMDCWERVKQGEALHPCSCAQHCHHLGYLGCDLRIAPCSTGLSKCFFSVYLAAESQDRFDLMWEGQQWTFQVLLLGYLHNHTCHGMVTWHLSLLSFRTPITWAHHSDEMMLTYKDCLWCRTLQEHLQGRGWQGTHRKLNAQALPLSFGWVSCTLSHKLWLIEYRPIQLLKYNRDESLSQSTLWYIQSSQVLTAINLFLLKAKWARSVFNWQDHLATVFVPSIDLEDVIGHRSPYSVYPVTLKR